MELLGHRVGTEGFAPEKASPAAVGRELSAGSDAGLIESEHLVVLHIGNQT